MKRLVLLGLLALALLVGGGAAGFGIGRATSDEDRLRALVEDKNEVILQEVDALELAQDSLDQIEGDLPAREAALDTALADLESREQTVEKARRQTLRAIEDVQAREKAVGIVERRIARNTIGGEGIYRVGDDMRPGTYRSVRNGAGCYYAVNADANGDNILTNGFVNGPALVTVAAGQFFETSGCDDWVLQD